MGANRRAIRRTLSALAGIADEQLAELAVAVPAVRRLLGLSAASIDGR